MKKFSPTGKEKRYTKEYDYAAQIVIRALIEKGREFITLDEIYDILGAKEEFQKNPIQYAILHCKAAKILKTIKGERGVYEVVKN